MAAHLANIGVTDGVTDAALGHELGYEEEVRRRPAPARPGKAFWNFFGKASRIVDRRSAKHAVPVRCFPNVLG